MHPDKHDPDEHERVLCRRAAWSLGLLAGTLLAGSILASVFVDALMIDCTSILALVIAAKVAQRSRGGLTWALVIAVYYAVEALLFLVLIGAGQTAHLAVGGRSLAAGVAPYAAAGMAVLLAWSLASLRFIWRARTVVGRRARGLCIYCGYNLTGDTVGRCPECGRSRT